MPHRAALADQRSKIELHTVYEISRGLCASLDIRHSFHRALRVLSAQLELPRLMLVLPDDANQCLAVHSAVGLTPEQSRAGLWQVDEGVIGRVFTSGLPMVLPDTADAPEFIDPTRAFHPRADRPAALLVVPLRAEQAVLGVLAAQRTLGDSTRLTDDQQLLTLVASLLAQALLLHQAVSSEHQRLQEETTQLRKALYRERGGPYTLPQVIGTSKPMQRLFAEVHKAAPSKATVLLRGESGTGKEAVARAVHSLSSAKDGPFIAINCAAVAETLLESELFGHERGAFTGALNERKGRFEQAHKGSLFLDEIGDISANFQAKLLRVLQEREFERVGGSRPVKVDVRLICATNRDLEAMVRDGDFRADLYYRINVIAIVIPPLRDRREDIPALIDHFLAEFNRENQRALQMTPEARQILQHCQWPGNVRELQNCIERSAAMARDQVIRAPDVACQQNRCLTKTLNHFGEDHAPEDAEPSHPIERERLIRALEQSGWVQAKAARLLNLSARQLSHALQRHHIEIRKL